MVLFDGALGLAFLGLWIFCIIDVITTPDGHTRNLPKLAWLVIVILLMDVGSAAWLIAGRTWNGEQRRPAAGRPARSTARSTARPVAASPDDDEEFLASLRSRTEEQRRRAREAQTKDQRDRPVDDA